MLKHSRTRTSQPQGAAQVDWSNPITRGMRVAVTCIPKPVDIVSGRALSKNGSALVVPGVDGLGVSSSASSDLYLLTGISPVAVTGKITAATICSWDVVDTTRRRQFRFAGSTSTVFQVEAFTNGHIYTSARIVGGTYPDNSSDFTHVGNKKYVCVAIHDPALSAPRLFIDGVNQSVVSTTGTGNRYEEITQVFIGNSGSGTPNLGKNFLTVLWERELSAGEVISFYENPWQIFKPRSFPLFNLAASGSDTSIAPGAGSLAFTSYAPAVAQTANPAASPSAGSVTLSGHAPTVAQTANQAITPIYGSLALTGYAPGVAQSVGTDVVPGAGSLTLSGYAPTIAQPVALAPGYGSLTLAGYAPSVTQSAGANVLPGVGGLALTGYAPGIAQPIAVQPAAGSLAITGYAPTVAQPKDITAGAGSVAITGYAPNVARTDSQAVAPGYGILTIVGYVPSVVQASTSPNLSPGTGALSLTGYAPTVEQSQPAATGGGGRFKRKRVFIDGKEHFLNPVEVASLLIERAAALPEAGEEAASIPEVAESPAADPVYSVPAVDYEAVRARADVQASQAFIDRMNAEIERMHRLAIQRQADEEDDIECLMLLL